MTKKVDQHQGTTFKNNWIMEFGLEIAARDPKTGDICSVKCWFCEKGQDADGKRKRTEHTKYYQHGGFQKDNILCHLKQQHNTCCLEYVAKS